MPRPAHEFWTTSTQTQANIGGTAVQIITQTVLSEDYEALPICQHAAEEARLCILSASTSWGSGGPDFDDCTASDMLLMLKMWPAGPVQEAAESAGSEELREYIINVPNAQLVSLNRWIESWHLGDISLLIVSLGIHTLCELLAKTPWWLK
ncbi:hypothetical protein K432DRAFT_390218 [Lepidopterella palustris CBS 459.81]|uniref:Uncharacterized protein n=1 Tax=Lepidopterella palustris CBS 459.81 TaxID=1314670 RepID=A0A8E2EGQ0_9PEZI|nr:hypothetical protein K432DRAFT_390218 [Lepidopterella palustris CBS 459.81]